MCNESWGEMKKTKNSGAFTTKKTILWMILFVAIAAISIYTIAAQSTGFSSKNFFEYIKNANPYYILLAILSMLGFIIFEGLAVIMICKALGYRRGIKSGFIYSASDIYFSALTPSATGGQPASVWFMIKDGISGTASVVALVVNLVFYSASIILIGLITFIFAPNMFFDFTQPCKLLIVAGFCLLSIIAAFFILILIKENIVYACAAAFIKFFAKLKIVKHPEKLNIKLKNVIYRYKECASLIWKNKKLMFGAFLFNLLQRACQITVTMFTFLAVGGSWGLADNAWFVQSYTVLGSNIVPIPGAMGVSDYILLDGLDNIIASDSAVNLELLSRAISFYSMIAICGVAILIKYIFISKNNTAIKEGK